MNPDAGNYPYEPANTNTTENGAAAETPNDSEERELRALPDAKDDPAEIDSSQEVGYRDNDGVNSTTERTHRTQMLDGGIHATHSARVDGRAFRLVLKADLI
jgi:hypothetical protein